ncbi:MAG: hypothetical protein AAFV80_21360 [Bacteroidota bacterium]
MQIFKNSNYRITFEATTKTLTFHWEEGHPKMNYEDFQEACTNFLGYGFEYQAQNILIDVRNFQLQLPPEFPSWQNDHHYPRYYKLGIQKVAYVMPEAYLAEAKTIKKLPGKFELLNFSSPEAAYTWIQSSTAHPLV